MDRDLRSPRTQTQLDAITPSISQSSQAMKITEAQKQALIDNLQLEVTERARKLRAQYALQAQSLRTRIELRINRIPTAIRKSKMGDLWEVHRVAQNKPTTMRKTVPSQSMTVSVAVNAPEDVPTHAKKNTVGRAQSKLTKQPAMGTKRTRYCPEDSAASTHGSLSNSDEMMIDDKENTPDPQHMLPNPKKRTKHKDPSRQAPNHHNVLSPKSSNSQNLSNASTRSHLTSPQKFYFSRPTSPLKPSIMHQLSPARSSGPAATANPVVLAAGTSKTTRAKTTKGRQAGLSNQAGTKAKARQPYPGESRSELPETRLASSSSNASMTSSATTIVRKTARSTKAAAKLDVSQVKKGTRGGKAVATTRIEAPLAGRRVLRTRG